MPSSLTQRLAALEAARALTQRFDALEARVYAAETKVRKLHGTQTAHDVKLKRIDAALDLEEGKGK